MSKELTRRAREAAHAPSRMFGGGGFFPAHGPLVQRMCAKCADDERDHEIQAKLTIGAPGDVYEREADQVADRIMSGGSAVPGAQGISRIQRLTAGPDRPSSHPVSHARIDTRRGAGRPLPPGSRQFFEPRLGSNLDRVRIHSDPEAQTMAKSIDARAFTYSSGVYFGAGQYRPDTPVGKHLLAHELTHTIQQGAAQQLPRVTSRRAGPTPANPAGQPTLTGQRKPACACGGGGPQCMSTRSQFAVSQPGDRYEKEADRAADQVVRMADAGVKEPLLEAGIVSPVTLQRRGADASGPSMVPTIVHDVLRAPGQPLDTATRALMEPRFGEDFSDVRVHADSKATESARAVNALAYTVGHDIVVDRDHYSPGTANGNRLIAHEIAHVQQQRGSKHFVQRTPASQVSCAGAPLHIPGTPPVVIADPVDVITAAENRAAKMMDDVIKELVFTRQRILDGAPVGWPTISDAIASGLLLMGLDPDDQAIWTAPAGTGTRSVPLLVRRLRLIRGTIGAGSFFFFCLGTGMTRLRPCADVASGDLCTNAVAQSCPGSFLIAFCPDFWTDSKPEEQAATIIHESAHNFATFIGDTGRFTNAECFARLVQVYAGVPEAFQRPDLCPNP